MSKKQTTTSTDPIVSAYTLVQQQGAWAVVRVKTQGLTVLSVEKIAEPDMRGISEAKLLNAIKADQR